MSDVNLFGVLLAITPVIVIFILFAGRHFPADISGAFGWVFTALIAAIHFKTGWNVIRGDCRIVALLKTISPQDIVVQVMLINIGLGTLLTASGAVPVSILPPIMLSLGYSSFVAIALPAR